MWGTVRVFKTRGFSRFMRKEGITDDALRDAVARAERGLIDADLESVMHLARSKPETVAALLKTWMMDKQK